MPTPATRTQIAYGADARVQDLLAVGDASQPAGIRATGRDRGRLVLRPERRRAHRYDPATGVTCDGISRTAP